MNARRCAPPGVAVEVEVESLAELEQALEAGVERVLLDNFGLSDLRAAVALNGGGRASRHPAGSRSSGCASSRRRGSTTSRWGI
jgi:nicotinate-nucleotide pyrophosphorylase (carboxylating)